jgi:hypothetical protein
MAWAGAAEAQQGTGALTGTVFDAASRKPLADVIVMVTSPALQEAQYSTTDASGFYRIPGLSPGAYKIRFEKEGFFPSEQDGIALRADVTFRLNPSLAAAQGEATEVVVKVRPTVDVGSSTSSTSLNSEILKRVPVSAPGGKGSASRSFESVATVAPGANADNYGTGINGASSPENHYSVDGLSVGNPGKGTVGTQLSSEFVEEVNVVTAGYMPEFGRSTGGVLNVVTKQGSNELHGQVFSYFSPGTLEGKRKVVQQDLTPVVYSPSLSYIGDLGLDLGGPVVKDKLWFYVGFDIAQTRYNVDRSIYRSHFDAATMALGDIDPNPLFGETYVADARTINAMAKLTWSINADNKVTLAAYGTPTTSGGGAGFDGKTVTPGKYAIAPLSGSVEAGGNGTYGSQAHYYVSTPVDASAKWNSQFLGKRLLLDVMLGTHYQKDSNRASDGSSSLSNSTTALGSYYNVNYRRANTMGGYHDIRDFEGKFPGNGKCDEPGFTCQVAEYSAGAPRDLNEAVYSRYHGSAIVSYLASALGHHIFKVGFDSELTSYQNQKSNRVFTESEDGTQFNDEERFGVLTAPDTVDFIDPLTKKTSSLLVGGFIQDSWSVLDKITFNLGIRYDSQYFYNTEGAVALSLPNQWSPRLGVIYDPLQNGKSKVFFNYARYYENAPLDFADVALVGEPQVKGGHLAVDADGNKHCDPAVFANQRSTAATSGCQNLDNLVPNTQESPALPNKNFYASGSPNTLDPAVKASSADEISAGGEYEVMPDTRAGLTYTRRWINRWIEDMGPVVGQPGYAGNPGYGLGNTFPKVSRNYNAATLFLMKNFSQSWLAQASYTIASLRGNYAGLAAPEDNYLGPNATADFDGPNVENNRYGALPEDIRHTVKVLASRDWQLTPAQHIGTGVALKARSGGATSYLGADPFTYGDESYLTPRGSGPRLPWNFGADVQLSYRLAAGKGMTISATVDIFNVFNLQAVTNTVQSYTSSNVIAEEGFTKTADLNGVKPGDTYQYGKTGQPIERNPAFGQPAEYQDPRVFRFGLRGEF